jgi:RNase P/RNase MRP subunit p30
MAARDNRVDILNFPLSYSNRTRVWFDSQEASLASRSNCAYEINFMDLLIEDSLLAKTLSRLELEVANAKKCSVPIVVSSGASDPAFIREPRALVSVLGIIGIGEEEGLDMVSWNPNRIVETNRSKLYPNNVSREVREV